MTLRTLAARAASYALALVVIVGVVAVTYAIIIALASSLGLDAMGGVG